MIKKMEEWSVVGNHMVTLELLEENDIITVDGKPGEPRTTKLNNFDLNISMCDDINMLKTHVILSLSMKINFDKKITHNTQYYLVRCFRGCQRIGVKTTGRALRPVWRRTRTPKDKALFLERSGSESSSRTLPVWGAGGGLA